MAICGEKKINLFKENKIEKVYIIQIISNISYENIFVMLLSRFLMESVEKNAI